MNFTKNLSFVLELLKYTNKNFSICKFYQVQELKKQKINKEIIEFGSNNYDESLIKYYKKKISKIYYSNIFKKNNKDYFSINLEKKNNIKKKFSNILAFNVLEHIYNDSNAISEFKKMLKPNGKLYISTPFLYRYHQAPKDYKRYKLDYFEKILKDKKFKIKKKISFGTGPFLASYALMFDYIKKIPLICYPIVLFCYLMDNFLLIFHKKNKNNLYPVCIFIVAQK